MNKTPEDLKLSTLVMSDPITPSTEEKRRNLLFVASASILLTVYNLKVNKTPWLDLEVPAGAPGILKGALSAALVYTLLLFILYAWIDVQRWFLSRDLVRVSGYHEMVRGIHNHINGISHLLNESMQPNVSAEQMAAAARSQVQAEAHLNSLLSEMRTLRRSHTTLTYAQWLRLVVLDIGVPLFLGIFALAKIGPALPSFISAMFQ